MEIIVTIYIDQKYLMYCV